jgi:hypothetical protein
MKIRNITQENIDRFFEVIDQCEGKIEIVTNDMRLNIKSKITQYVSIAKLFFNNEIKDEIEIIAYCQEDVNKIIDFMLHG